MLRHVLPLTMKLKYLLPLLFVALGSGGVWRAATGDPTGATLRREQTLAAVLRLAEAPPEQFPARLEEARQAHTALDPDQTRFPQTRQALTALVQAHDELARRQTGTKTPPDPSAWYGAQRAWLAAFERERAAADEAELRTTAWGLGLACLTSGLGMALVLGWWFRREARLVRRMADGLGHPVGSLEEGIAQAFLGIGERDRQLQELETARVNEALTRNRLQRKKTGMTRSAPEPFPVAEPVRAVSAGPSRNGAAPLVAAAPQPFFPLAASGERHPQPAPLPELEAEDFTGLFPPTGTEAEPAFSSPAELRHKTQGRLLVLAIEDLAAIRRMYPTAPDLFVQAVLEHLALLLLQTDANPADLALEQESLIWAVPARLEYSESRLVEMLQHVYRESTPGFRFEGQRCDLPELRIFIDPNQTEERA